MLAAATISIGACAGDGVARPGEAINDSASLVAGRLDGVVTRMDGAPAQGLSVSALNHGVVIATMRTDGVGAFSMRFVVQASPQQLTDTLFTYFVQSRTAVGSVTDSLVLREAVQVRMTRNLNAPAITTATLRAAY